MSTDTSSSAFPESLPPYPQPYKQSRNLNKGRIVIVRVAALEFATPALVYERPAIVTRVWSPDTINAVPFGAPLGPELTSAVYSLEPLNNTWCWCDEQDMTKQAE